MSDRICVYRAHGPTDAYAVRDWLRRNDIDAVLRGEGLLGVVGAIPIHDTWPTIWVRADEADAARKAIDQLSGPTLVHPAWACPKCGEENPPTFASCWSCGQEMGPTG